MDKYEIITFQDNTFKLDVNVSPSEDTVWLTQEDIALLFSVERSVITKHINNIYNSKELSRSTRANFAHVRFEGNRKITRKIQIYNLDLVLAVGYRVNSKRGILFRKWATSILKNYMLNKTDDCKECKQHIINLDNRVQELEQSIKHEFLIASGDELKGYLSIKRFLETAKESIYIFDNYFDDTYDDVLKGVNVPVVVVTNIKNTKIESNDIYKVIKTNEFHDRYIFVDDIGYILGCSFKDIGKKTSTAVRIYDTKVNNLLKNYNNHQKSPFKGLNGSSSGIIPLHDVIRTDGLNKLIRG